MGITSSSSSFYRLQLQSAVFPLEECFWIFVYSVSATNLEHQSLIRTEMLRTPEAAVGGLCDEKRGGKGWGWRREEEGGSQGWAERIEQWGWWGLCLGLRSVDRFQAWYFPDRLNGKGQRSAALVSYERKAVCVFPCTCAGTNMHACLPHIVFKLFF